MHLYNDAITAPARIRGRRNALPEENCTFGKRRDPRLRQRRANTTTYGRQDIPTMPSEEPSSTSRPRKRRRRRVPHSPLEALPPEVLQSIFAYSANIMFPLTSTQLASKLCNSMHLRYELSDCLLNPVLGCAAATRVSEAELTSATRLLNSRFMDFAFFKTWLRSRSGDEASMSISLLDTDEIDWKALWLAFQPSPGLLPPRKLFSPPFSNDKTSYLSILAQTIDDIVTVSPSYGELAYEALTAAVQSGHVELASVLLGMGINATTDTLRAAVIDAACERHLVQLLLRSASSHELDLLDPMVWSWAGKASENGDPNGNWLMDLLRKSQEGLRASAG